jgi:hypothetical protein
MSCRRVGALWVAVALLLGGTAARAAEPAAPALGFTGLAEAALMASPLTADGTPCGLDLARLGAAARQPLANGGLGLRDDAPARVALSAVTIRVPGTEHCATTVLFGVYALENFFSASAGWLSSGYVVVWQRTLMVATPLAAHPAAVDRAVGRLAEQMLAAWREQNRPGQTMAEGSAGSR